MCIRDRLSLEPNESIGDISRWCERVSGGIFREPSNALSNIGFMILGIYMFWVLGKDIKSDTSNQFTGLNSISILYAGAAIFLGPGSLLMHGTHTEWGEWADNLSMIMYIIIPWLLNIKEMGRWSLKTFFSSYFLIVFVYAVTRWLFGSDLGINLDLFGLSIGLWVISETLFRFWSPLFRWISGFIGFLVAAIFGIMPTDILAEPVKFWWVILFWVPAILSPREPKTTRRYTPWYFLGIAAYMIAFAIWLQGRPNNPWCVPDSRVQAHAQWHLLTAIASLCFFKFLRTEVPKEHPS